MQQTESQTVPETKIERLSLYKDMVWISDGTFLMGSDKHYPDEAPTHRATVDGFLTDKCAITNERFARFIEATGHITSAELPPNPEDYPGATPEMLRPAARMAQPVDSPACHVGLRLIARSQHSLEFVRHTARRIESAQE